MPESIDFAAVDPLVLAALERRHAGRRTGELSRRLPALVIARRFKIREGGSDDSRKRGVRKVIDRLRKGGAPIVADFEGYYLAGERADWTLYREFRRRMGLAHLAGAAEAEKSEAHADATGQLGLFNERAKARR